MNMNKSLALSLGLLVVATSLSFKAQAIDWKKYTRKAASYSVAIGALGYCLKNMSLERKLFNLDGSEDYTRSVRYGPIRFEMKPFSIVLPIYRRTANDQDSAVDLSYSLTFKRK